MPPRPLSTIERAVLTAPGAAARAAAMVADDAQQRWMLAQDRDVRRTYAAEVLDHPEDPAAEERWMLLQDDEICRSYADEVEPPAEQAWLLRQSRDVRESYVRDVLGG